MRTYCVIIKSNKVFKALSTTALCFLRNGLRGVLVTLHDPKGLTVIKTMKGNQSKNHDVVTWCQSNLIKELTLGPKLSPRAKTRAIQCWVDAQGQVEVMTKKLAEAVKAEEDARMALARAMSGGPCVIDGKTFYPMHATNKEGQEVVYYFRTPGPWNLDTV